MECRFVNNAFKLNIFSTLKVIRKEPGVSPFGQPCNTSTKSTKQWAMSYQICLDVFDEGASLNWCIFVDMFLRVSNSTIWKVLKALNVSGANSAFVTWAQHTTYWAGSMGLRSAPRNGPNWLGCTVSPYDGSTVSFQNIVRFQNV